MTRERKKTIWDQLPNAVSGMRSPLSSAQQARSKMLWGRLRTGLPLRTAEQSRRLQLMKRLHKRFAKGRLELPVEQRRRDAARRRRGPVAGPAGPFKAAPARRQRRVAASRPIACLWQRRFLALVSTCR